MCVCVCALIGFFRVLLLSGRGESAASHLLIYAVGRERIAHDVCRGIKAGYTRGRLRNYPDGFCASVFAAGTCSSALGFNWKFC